MKMLDDLRRMLNDKRARDAIDAAAPGLARTVAGMAMAERAAVMIIAHAMLRDAAQDYGTAVVANPSRLRPERLAELLTRLGGLHRRLTASLDAVSGHVAGDLVYAGVLRQIRAAEVAIVTLGMAKDRTLVAAVKQVWRALWQARTHAVDGVRLIQAFERAMHERALPASQPKDPEKMARLATRLPEMFRAARPGGTGTGTAAAAPPRRREPSGRAAGGTE